MEKSIQEQLNDVMIELKKANAPGAGLPPMGMESADPMMGDAGLPVEAEAAMEGEPVGEEMAEGQGGDETAAMVKELTEILGLTPEQVAKLEMVLEQEGGGAEEPMGEMPQEVPEMAPEMPVPGGEPAPSMFKSIQEQLDETIMLLKNGIPNPPPVADDENMLPSDAASKVSRAIQQSGKPRAMARSAVNNGARNADEARRGLVALGEDAPRHVVSESVDIANNQGMEADHPLHPMIETMAEKRNKETGFVKSIQEQIAETERDLKKYGEPMQGMMTGGGANGMLPGLNPPQGQPQQNAPAQGGAGGALMGAEAAGMGGAPAPTPLRASLVNKLNKLAQKKKEEGAEEALAIMEGKAPGQAQPQAPQQAAPAPAPQEAESAEINEQDPLGMGE